MNPSHNRALHVYAVCTAACTLVLVVAGALVTSNDAGLAVPDWPLSYGSLLPPMVGGIFWEHGHRMIATLVGLLTIGLAVWLWRREPRPWVRRLGWIALAAVIVQGLLGGLTVLFFLPRPVSIAHASLAQLFFCLTVSIALFTSRWWQQEFPPLEEAGQPGLRKLAVLTAGVVFIQLVLGAAFRHNAAGVLPHILWAAVVLVMATYTGRVVRLRYAGVHGLRLPSQILAALVGTQIVLGSAAFWSRLVGEGYPQPIVLMVSLTVAHVAVGAVTLAASVVLAICSFRLLRPATAPAPVSRTEHATSFGETA
jgi:cytochrome c oxidase assembly protein subunit 15